MNRHCICVLTVTLPTLAGGAVFGQLNLTSINERVRAQTWIISPSGTDDGGLFDSSNNVAGPWSTDFTSTASLNSSRAMLQASVAPGAISATGLITATRMGVPINNEVYSDMLSSFAVTFEVLAAAQVEFDASVNPVFSLAPVAGLERLSPGGPLRLAQANIFDGGISASFDGVLIPGTYRVYGEAPSIVTAIRPGNSSPLSFTDSFSLSFVVVPAPAGTAAMLLGVVTLTRRRR